MVAGGVEGVVAGGVEGVSAGGVDGAVVDGGVTGSLVVAGGAGGVGFGVGVNSPVNHAMINSTTTTMPIHNAVEPDLRGSCGIVM